MRSLMVATALLAMGTATVASAGERVVSRGGGHGGMKAGGWQGQRGGTWNQGGWNRGGWNRPGGHVRPRWGGHVQGRWWGGHRAPGGWGAYRRPVRGWVLPSYWIAPSWYVTDWSGYGLPQPQQGYTWSRYYDDAVLVDGRGSVHDTMGGVDWDSVDPDGVDYAYDDRGYDDGVVYDGRVYSGGAAGAPYPYPEPRRDAGLGGAAIGAVAGGVAGNVIAGRGNRLGGTLIGAGVGAVAGYAIDKAEDRGAEDRGRRGPPPPGYGAGYPPPRAGGPGYPPPPRYHQGSTVIGSGTTVVTSGYPGGGYPGGGYPAAGYYANGYYYPGPTITTVTVQSQPVVTTTTEAWETHRRPAKVWRKKTWRAGPKCICR
ncbi:RcnB family protein [Sphingomonas sp. SUN019]|uniref:RcnB family protein n=1 Tax=Sphingomonas sp. SUN019 TaxID=2937788 RepID=UPI0021647F66|nr:RcnB family protein [Sphingomonas sp. SUN019]UVO49774.1 RcnB family protein [Sphingomonas sp. SUN019]